MDQEPKPLILSKTVIVQALVLICLQYPSLKDLLAPYMVEAGSAWAVLNILLRLITKDRVKIL